MKRRRQSLLFGILLLIMGLGLGYAFLTTTLNIEGIADIGSNEWNKSILKEALGEENCVEDTTSIPIPTYDCDTSSWKIKVKKDGEIIVRSKAGAEQISCSIDDIGIASCGVLLD